MKKSYMFINRIGGFTLAELLVTLGIIGVIAILTIPSLMQANQKKVFVTQLKKVVSEVSQALDTAMEDTNAPTIYATKLFLLNKKSDFFTKYMKTSQTGFNTSSNSCFASDYDDLWGSRSLSGTIFTNYTCDGWSCTYYPNWALLKDGACVSIRPNNDSGKTLLLYVDVNGKQGPNVEGRDLFGMKVDEKGNINKYLDGSSGKPRWFQAFDRIVKDGWEMKY